MCPITRSTAECQRTVKLKLQIEPPKDLSHTSAADAKIARQSRTALELLGVEKRLVVPGQVQRIRTRFRGSFGTRFCLAGGSDGADGDNRRATYPIDA
jgi:hypothetical protein